MRKLTAAIILSTIWSGALFGDDGKTATAPGGYRDGVTASQLDATDPDPLVDLEEMGIPCIKVYHIGAVPGLCPYYGKGLGAPKRTLGRLPMANAIKAMNRLVAQLDREYVVIDAFREDWVQARLHANVFQRNVEDAGLVGVELSTAQFLNLAFAADNIASYNRLDKTSPSWIAALEELKSGPRWAEIVAYAEAKGEDPDYIAEEYVTFVGNYSVARGEKKYVLDRNGFTAHGGGGAADIYPRRKSTGQWLNLGVPFDSTSEASRLDWFETHTVDDYRRLIENEVDLRQYLNELGVWEVTPEVFEGIREERRILFNALMYVGGSPYIGEPWHCNFSHEFGGKHVGVLPAKCGNSCQSWIWNVRVANNNDNEELVAIWTNSVAHQLAKPFYDPGEDADAIAA